jgi:hypothetical protein
MGLCPTPPSTPKNFEWPKTPFSAEKMLIYLLIRNRQYDIMKKEMEDMDIEGGIDISERFIGVGKFSIR